MIISVDKDNLIVAYAEVGGLEGGIEISNSILPDTFIAEFKNKKFKYENGIVSYNKNYVDEVSADLKSSNESLEDKVKTLEDRVKELEDIIANNQVPE